MTDLDVNGNPSTYIDKKRCTQNKYLQIKISVVNFKKLKRFVLSCTSLCIFGSLFTNYARNDC